MDEFVELVRRHRPKAVSLVPTALEMVLDAQVDPDDLSSILVVTSGSAALPIEVQEAFERRATGSPCCRCTARRSCRRRGRGGRCRCIANGPRSSAAASVAHSPAASWHRRSGNGSGVRDRSSGQLEVRSRDGEWTRTTDVAVD